MKVLIVGAGKLGYKLAESMIHGDIHVTIIDKNPKVLERINDHLDVLTVKANGVQLEVLNELKISNFDLLIAVTDSDEANMVICSLGKKLGCPQTISRIRNPEYAQQIEFIKSEMGIDHVINPELATANEILRYLLKRYTFFSEDYAKGKVSMVDFKISKSPNMIGKSVKELDNMDGLLITAISRLGEIIIPHGNTKLSENDIIYIIGEKDSITKFKEKSNIDIEKRNSKKVMILGGGKIGYYLAQKLEELNMNVKIIEKDRERCKYLSENLKNALVILGDGADINLLEEEDISSMDAFIGVTGYDEENLFMTLMAKQSGVKKVIAKVSRQSYVHIIEKLGIDVALNPVNITASDILKFIRGGKVVSVSLLLGGKAEVTEIIASESLSIIGKSISQLGLNKGIIIGSIVHNGKVIIPNGDSVIHPNDRLVIFCLTSEIPSLEAFFKPKKGGVLNELWNRNKGTRNSFNF